MLSLSEFQGLLHLVKLDGATGFDGEYHQRDPCRIFGNVARRQHSKGNHTDRNQQTCKKHLEPFHCSILERDDGAREELSGDVTDAAENRRNDGEVTDGSTKEQHRRHGLLSLFQLMFRS